MDTIKILYYSEGWGMGGIERFIMNTVETLDNEKFSFDIFTTHDWDTSYDEKIAELGGKRFVVFKGHKPNLLTRLYKSTKNWRDLLTNNHYDVVHINTMNGTGFLYAFIAKTCGVKNRIVHSHNASFGSGQKVVKKIVHRLGRLFFGHSATTRLACSKAAGYFLFGNCTFKVINNGIDIEHFAFSDKERKKTRRELGIPENAMVFGAIGRLTEAKNPLYQVKILRELHRHGEKAVLLLVGSGELKDKVSKYAIKLGLSEFVRLIDNTSNPRRYYSSLDIYTLPSIFEGFPTVLVEASANGLPLVVSNNIELGNQQLPRIQIIPLSDTEAWVEALIQNGNACRFNDREKARYTLFTRGFDREKITGFLEKIYFAPYNVRSS